MRADSQGLRRDNIFNGGICARIDEDQSGGSGGASVNNLVPQCDMFADDPISVNLGTAANQVGYPTSVDRCWCTGRGTQLRCSSSGLRDCPAGSSSCTPMPPLPAGNFSMCAH